MNTSEILSIAKNTREAYGIMIKPLCDELDLPKTAFDILMFLLRNPLCMTAKDIQKYKDIKPNLISHYVNELVYKGYLEREPMSKDRRQVKLICTKKAKAFYEEGQLLQKEFFVSITKGFTKEEQEKFIFYLQKVSENAEKIINDHQ